MRSRAGLPALAVAAALLARPDAGGADIPPITNAGPVDARRAVSGAQSEFDRYLKNARRLRTFHDSGALQEGDVFRVLGSEGVIPALGQGFRPFHVPVYKGRWRWPLRAGIVSSSFGPRWGRNHDGIDVAADLGVPVYAAAAGRVIYAGDGLRGYGNVVILRHDQKTTTLYAHNQRLRVKAGEDIERGQVIALLGSTGRSTGPHVHFEIRVSRKPINPRRLLPKSRYIKG